MENETQQTKPKQEIINQEILNILEDKKFISSFQLEKIKDFLKSNYENSFKEFYNHFQDYHNKKKLSYTQFVNILINDYMINENDDEDYKIFDSFTIYQIEKENIIYNFFENLENETTEDLKNYDSDDEKFNTYDDDIYYDIYTEDFKTYLDINNDEYKKLNFSNYNNNNTYLKIDGFNLLSDFEYYNTFKEFFEDLENLIFNMDFNLKTQVYHRFLLDNDLFNHYLSYNNKNFKKLDEDIKKEIVKILIIRLKDNKKDLRKNKAKLKELSVILDKSKNPLIKDSIKVNIEKVNTHIKMINNEINIIKGK